MHMIEPDRFVLNDQDWKYHIDLEQAWLLISGETRESVAIRLIQSSIPGAVSWFRANRMLRDVEVLYAPFLKKNREVQRARVIEKLYEYAAIAEKKAIYTDEEGLEYIDQEWFVIAQKCLKDAAEMEGLNEDASTLINPDDVLIPEFEVTSDPQAFLEEQLDDYEDIPDEEDGEYEDDE